MEFRGRSFPKQSLASGTLSGIGCGGLPHDLSVDPRRTANFLDLPSCTSPESPDTLIELAGAVPQIGDYTPVLVLSAVPLS